VSSRLEQVESGDPWGRHTVVIPYGVRGVAPRTISRRQGSTLQVGFLARIDPKKNLDLLIRALAIVGDDVELVVAGDGPAPYVQQLKQLAHELGVSSRITWLGFIGSEAKSDFLGTIDVLAMPSDYECFCISVVEALSAGVPVVVSPRVAVSDVVAAHEAGLIVRPQSDSIAAALSRLTSSPALLEKLGNATRSAAAEFSVERHGEHLEREYTRVLARTSLGIL
jgi:glycosyltransferase involved in cell wall biosynthesis